MRTKTFTLSLFLMLLIGLFSHSTASATSIVTYTNIFDGAGLWTYTLTVKNTDLDPLFDFVTYTGPLFSPTTAADLSGVGWSTDIGAGFVHWIADPGAEIVPGNNMGGFWFTYAGNATDNIGPLPYETITWHDDSYGGYANPAFSGVTQLATPTSVPEPGTLVLLSAGLAGAGILCANPHLREYLYLSLLLCA